MCVNVCVCVCVCVCVWTVFLGDSLNFSSSGIFLFAETS